MPLAIPKLDGRRFKDLVEQAKARIPSHTPEWTNFNAGDPGITLVELFAFLAESLLYRANQIPERNRRAFLNLLGVPLHAGTPARGLVEFANERGPLETVTLRGGLEVRAGSVTFRTRQGLDVLPVESFIAWRRELVDADAATKDHYRSLYLAQRLDAASGSAKAGGLPEPTLYETVPLGAEGVDLGPAAGGALGGALFIALLARKNEDVAQARTAIAGKTLSLAVVPRSPATEGRRLGPDPEKSAAARVGFTVEAPDVADRDAASGQREVRWRELVCFAGQDLTVEPGILQAILPAVDQLGTWDDLDPNEEGVGEYPPPIEDEALRARVITWLRVRTRGTAPARLSSLGLNGAEILQGDAVASEPLADGTGQPDQLVKLARTPVEPDSVRLQVTHLGTTSTWREIDDLLRATREGTPPAADEPPQDQVFLLDAEAGTLRFGDGIRGARPPAGAKLRASYTVSVGAAGNLPAGRIDTAPGLPSGFKVRQPVATWGGTAPETVRDGERQVARWLQHRDRLVTARDFETIAWRAPGVELGRIEVLPAVDPRKSAKEAGAHAGCVTLLVVPRHDRVHPRAPRPDEHLLKSLCTWLDPRRLVTTELFLRGPVYRPLFVSLGFTPEDGASVAEVRATIHAALLAHLSPLPPPDAMGPRDPADPAAPRGWPLRKSVLPLELLTVAARVPGVAQVTGVLLGDASGREQKELALDGLELPEVLALSVTEGAATPLKDLTGRPDPTATQSGVPVPVVPDECR